MAMPPSSCCGVEELRLHDDHLRRALQAIPEELYEAARIDGANALQQFRHVTLPMLGRRSCSSASHRDRYLQFFPEPYVMTRGGPVNSTLSVVMLMYEQGFKWWNMGYAAAWRSCFLSLSPSPHSFNEGTAGGEVTSDIFNAHEPRRRDDHH